jgi:hypothetical protein
VKRSMQEVAEDLARAIRRERQLRMEREQLEQELVDCFGVGERRVALPPPPCDTPGCVLPVHAGPHLGGLVDVQAEYVSEIAGLEHTDPRMQAPPESRLRESGAVREQRESGTDQRTTRLAGPPLSELSVPIACPGLPGCHRQLKHRHYADGSIVCEIT